MNILVEQEKIDIHKLSPIRTSEQITKLKKAGSICAEILNTLGDEVTPGITTRELDTLALKLIKQHGAELD